MPELEFNNNFFLKLWKINHASLAILKINSIAFRGMFVGDNIRASLISLHILEVSAKVKTKFHSLCLSSLGPLRAGQNCQKTNFPRSDHQPVIDGKLWLSLQLPCPAVGQFCAMFCTIYQSIPTVTDLEIQAQCP